MNNLKITPRRSKKKVSVYSVLFVMKFSLVTFLFMIFATSVKAQSFTAEEILARVLAAWQPASFHARVILEVQGDGESRSWEFEVWREGEEQALIRVLAPEEEAGSGYLVLGYDVWYYSPKLGTSIHLPILALSEKAFGGAAAPEDLLQGALTEECEVSAESREGGWLLVLIPKPEAPVLWGRLELVVRSDFAILEMRQFDQRGQLLRTARVSEFVELDGRSFPTVVEIEETDGDRVVERIVELEIGLDIPDEVFTLAFLEGR